MRKLTAAVVAALITAALFAGGASAAGVKQLWHIGTLDAAASEVAGTPLQVVSSDNDLEWLYINDGQDGVLGFTCPACSPDDYVYNGFDGYSYAIYRTVWIAPKILRTFEDIRVNGLRTGMNWYEVGMAMLTLDHEGMHWRLFSGDEGRVNACALQDLPRFLQTDWGVAPTVTQTVSVPVKVKVRYRVRWHGRYVWRYRWTTKYKATQQTVANPVMSGIVAGATAFYHDQPYPYNAGTCS